MTSNYDGVSARYQYPFGDDPHPSPIECVWLARRPDDDQLHFSVISLGEILKGVTVLPESKRRSCCLDTTLAAGALSRRPRAPTGAITMASAAVNVPQRSQRGSSSASWPHHQKKNSRIMVRRRAWSKFFQIF